VNESISGKYIYIASTSTLSTEIRYLEADAPDEKTQGVPAT